MAIPAGPAVDPTLTGGAWLRAARHARGLSARQLAERIGVHQTQVSNYENEKNAVPEERVKSIADALGVHVPYLRQRLGLWVPDPDNQTVTGGIRDDAHRVALDLAAGRTVDVPISFVTDDHTAEIFSRELAN
ncbi:helix-turn-helix transcriptional regulator, partial [Frankia sp. CpI1-P]